MARTPKEIERSNKEEICASLSHRAMKNHADPREEISPHCIKKDQISDSLI